MLHKRRSKSKGETVMSGGEHSSKSKRKAKQASLPFSCLGLGRLVCFLANEGRHVQVVRPCLHHRPRQVVGWTLHKARRAYWQT